MRVYNKSAYDSATFAYTSNGSALSLESIFGFSVQAQWVVTTATAAALASATDINSTTDVFTKTAHGFYTGLKVALTTGTTLPAGLSATNYYVIRLTSSTFQIASSQANALAGTPVLFTNNGTGTQTFTPAALGTCTVKLQATNDDASDSRVTAVWTDLASPQTVTATGNYLWNVSDSYYAYVRITGTTDAGQVVMSAKLNAKGV